MKVEKIRRTDGQEGILSGGPVAFSTLRNIAMQKSMWVLLALGYLLWVGGDLDGQPLGKKKPPVEIEPRAEIFRPAPAQPNVRRWEYHVRPGTPSQADLNKLGDEGWELTAVEPGDRSRGVSASYIFRRPATRKAKADERPAAPPAPKEKEAAKLELRVYALKHGSAADMAKILDDVLAINKYAMRIAAEPRSNQVIVNATKEAHGDIEALLQRLDVPAAGEGLPPGRVPGPGPFKKTK
jgi:hypothetical protein